MCDQPGLVSNKVMVSHCSFVHRPAYDDNSRVLDLADMPAALTTARAPVVRCGLNFQKLGCEKLAAWDLFAVFETDQVGLARGSRKTRYLVDEVAGGFDYGVVGVPLAAQESNRR